MLELEVGPSPGLGAAPTGPDREGSQPALPEGELPRAEPEPHSVQGRSFPHSCWGGRGQAVSARRAEKERQPWTPLGPAWLRAPSCLGGRSSFSLTWWPQHRLCLLLAGSGPCNYIPALTSFPPSANFQSNLPSRQEAPWDLAGTAAPGGGAVSRCDASKLPHLLPSPLPHPPPNAGANTVSPPEHANLADSVHLLWAARQGQGGEAGRGFCLPP